MNRKLELRLNKEADGVNGSVDVIDGDIVAIINFNNLKLIPVPVNEEILKEMKKEIVAMEKAIRQAKTEYKKGVKNGK